MHLGPNHVVGDAYGVQGALSTKLPSIRPVARVAHHYVRHKSILGASAAINGQQLGESSLLRYELEPLAQHERSALAFTPMFLCTHGDD